MQFFHYLTSNSFIYLFVISNYITRYHKYINYPLYATNNFYSQNNIKKVKLIIVNMRGD